MNDLENGYHNGNGNGKAFVLAQPKSPEQIERENLLKAMPELRRECSRDRRLSVGSKWFFGQLTDLSFLHTFGGNGFGVVHLSIKDLARIYGHDSESFEKWRDELVQCGWLWFVKSWPRSQWGISAVCKQPELFAPAFSPSQVDFIRTMAKASSTKPTEPALLTDYEKPEENGYFDRQNPITKPTEPAHEAGNPGTQSRENRIVKPETPAQVSRENRPHHPVEPAHEAGNPGTANGKHRPETTCRTPQLQESPIGDRSKGATKGVQAPPQSSDDPAFKKWQASLEGLYPSRLEKMRQSFKAQRATASEKGKALLKKKIAVLTELIEGPQPEMETKAAPAPARRAAGPKQPSADDLIEGAEYLASIGKENLMTDAQRQAWERRAK